MMSMRTVLRFALIVLVTLAPACAREVPENEATPWTFSSVRYELNTPMLPKELHTARGYTLSFTRAYLAHASIGLGRCLVLPPSARAQRTFEQVLGLPRARAGHDSGLDLSYVSDGIVQNLLRPGRTRFGESYFPAQRYCRVQHTSGRVDASFRAMPRDVSLSGYTFHVRGHYQGPQANGEFVVETDLPYGKLVELSQLHIPNGGPGTRALVTLTPALSHAFDELDFARDDLEAGSKRVLQRLIDAMDVRVTLEKER
jgi:hypothetical protein